jgi:D-serine deaminase-like pyridoxal phosphate-dependent protein
MSMFEHLPTPNLLVDLNQLQQNIQRMQTICDANQVELWPHIKTHKMVPIARMQLDAGARGLTCAKIGEAEALLPSGARRIFLAHSLVDTLQAPRLCALAESLEELILACTSILQAEALERVLAAAHLRLPIMMAIDTGLGREGARTEEEAVELARYIQKQPHMELRGLYTHEGHAYTAGRGKARRVAKKAHQKLITIRDRIDPALKIWPGCSVTAAEMATLPGVDAVRPGSYVFGDLSLTMTTGTMHWNDIALTVLATVIDRPELGMALVDAGSKTFSSDKTPNGLMGLWYDGRDIHIKRCSEEHGHVTGSQVDELRVGERVQIVPAHVCTAVNLADEVMVVRDGQVVDIWCIDARGKVQ